MKGAKPGLGNVIPMKEDMPAAPVAVPDAPSYLSDRARQTWDELAPILAASARLQPLFEPQFAAYCEAVACFVGAANELAMTGLWYETVTRNGRQQKKAAAWGIFTEAGAAMRQWSALFGMSPVDEKRLDLTGQGDLFGDIVAQLKGGNRAAG